MTPRLSLLLSGCHTMAQAEERVRAFLEAYAINAMGSFPSDIREAYLDDILLRNAAAIEEAMERFRALASEIYGDGTVH